MTSSRHTDLSLEYVLSVPTGAGDEAELPLVLVMHGRGADADDLAGIAPMIDSGYRFIFPNAPRRFEPAPGMSFGYSWFDGWPPTGSTFADSRMRVLTFLDEVMSRYPTPDGKLIVSGFSQGGMMSLDVGFRTAQKTAGVVVMSGALNEEELPPFSERKELPVLIVHGTADDMIPVLAAHRARRMIEDAGIDVDYHEFPIGHFVTPESLKVVSEFMRKCFTRGDLTGRVPEAS